MRFHLWAVVGLASAVASSFSAAATVHELHLPYLSPTGQNDHSDSYLSLNWAIVNGSLYANEDRVFPPAMSMQLHAPRREATSTMSVDQGEVEVSYSLEARPLSTEENGGTSRIVRVRVDLLSPDGRPVTPDTVVLDLLAKHDDTSLITRIRLEPAKARHAGHHGRRPWHMKFWRTQVVALFKAAQSKHASFRSISESKHSVESLKTLALPSTGPDGAAESQPGYILSPYWSPTHSRSSHRQSSHRDSNRTFVRLVRPIILPALLGAAAGLLACVVGFVVSHLVMSISVCLGFGKGHKQHRRTPAISVEDGTVSEKSQFVPKVYVTPC